MKCADCGHDNPKTRKFCGRCGARLGNACLECGAQNAADDRYCGDCGLKLGPGEAEPLPELSGERKQVTVVFTDLCGYTALSEKLDAEDVKELMERIFSAIAGIVAKYDGRVEHWLGDAAMILFGLPTAHEDDPLRAVKAAVEIHELVETIDPELEKRVGRPLSMHTGVNTGLVVSGTTESKGTEGLAGDSINLASRLADLAEDGVVMVGKETYLQTERYINFKVLGKLEAKGLAQPIEAFKVLSPKDEPVTVHRLSGLKAALIGRKLELAELQAAVNRLKQDEGGILAISGAAGTGKSRLVEELGARLDLKKIQWWEGHSYPYSQNIPYFLLVDLLNRAWQIKEGDASDVVRAKIESNLERLLGSNQEFAPYIGGLYALDYPELEELSPESRKVRLFGAVKALLMGLTQLGPIAVYLEDLHWADPSSIGLLKSIMAGANYRVLFICAFRPPFTLFGTHARDGFGSSYQEIELKDLSASETQDMTESLLETTDVPIELRRFVKDRVEGNPFYIEEVTNSLIESGTLRRINDGWQLTTSIDEAQVPPTVTGVIASRIDYLEPKTKRILQEASVVGRVFPQEILERITIHRANLDLGLRDLERYDFIRTRSFYPDVEHVFKHALTQEVVYNGLLKKERQEIHEKIGLVMESLFPDRLSEFCETLAFHFRESRSVHKAVDYLIRSGEKSHNRYAVEEAHRYFEEAFDILRQKPQKTAAERELVVDLLNRWAYVYWARGDFGGLTELLVAYEALVKSLADKVRLGMFYQWLGMAFFYRERFKEAYDRLHHALKLGEAGRDDKVVGYACAWLAHVCMELGLLTEAATQAERARQISAAMKSDHFLRDLADASFAYANWARGNKRKTFEVGVAMMDFGQKHSNIRSIAGGYCWLGSAHLMDDNLEAASECFRAACEMATDPWVAQSPNILLALSYVYQGRFDDAEPPLRQALDFGRKFGAEFIATPARALLGLVMLANGQLSRGIKELEETQRLWLQGQAKWRYMVSEHVLGTIYKRVIEGSGSSISLPVIVRNIGFMLTRAPFAAKKAEYHFRRAIEVADEIGAMGMLGQCYLDLASLYKLKGKERPACECASKSISYFEMCENLTYIKKAEEMLA